jgi:RNA polymerase sigma-70 factor (ECF subfamily)
MSARAAELAARTSYGRLLAILAARSGDIASAEDALAEAFMAALRQWHTEGVPDNPEAWLLTAARRRGLDASRKDSVRRREAGLLKEQAELLWAAAGEEPEEIPDERLRLLFVCTHPAIDPSIQVPLMLQTVLGLDAETIASAFRVAPKTLGQRLWRAKTKIREAGIAFEVPPRELLPERLHAVLESLYGAFGLAWDGLEGGSLRGLTEESLYLCRVLVALLPGEPEPLGLLSLMCFIHARSEARRDAEGEYVPLDQQDPSRWNDEALFEAESLLRRAFALSRLGPFQLEAALQSAHVAGVRSGRPDPEGVLSLYDGLVALAPSLGARVGRAAALLEARGPEAALAELEALGASDSRCRDYQPYWATRAEAARKAGHVEDSDAAYERALGLSEDDATRRFLLRRKRALAMTRR